MSKYVIEITDEGELYINGDKRPLIKHSNPYDPDDISMDQQAVISLVSVMGYEPVEFLEECADLILGHQFCDEVDEFLADHEDEDWD